MDKTTDLETIRKNPRAFTWGLVREIHDIGEITIVEYTGNDGERGFAVYVDGRDTSSGSSSLYRAVVLGIARKHGDHGAAKYASLILGLS